MEKKVAAISALVASSIMASGCGDLSAKRSLDLQTQKTQSHFATQQGSDGAVTKQWMSQYGSFEQGGRKELDKVQQKLNELKSSNSGIDPYSAGKAQCWIDVAQRQIDRGDKWGGVAEAIGQADRINGELAAGQSDSFGSPPLRTVVTVRPDLWEKLRAGYDSGTYASCPEARRRIACSEVMLEYAGHLAWTTDYSESVKTVKSVEKMQDSLEQGLESCPAAQAPSTASTQVVPASTAPNITEMREETLFDFSSAVITASGKANLDRFIADVSSSGVVKEFHVTGFTDRIGSDQYNERLSLRRADAVRGYIAGHTNWPGGETRGLAKNDPVVQCADASAQKLTGCLAPNRRVVTIVLRSGS